MVPELQIPQDIPTFADKKGSRTRIQDIYASYEILVKKFDWRVSIVHQLAGEKLDGQPVALPIVCLTTPKEGPAIWSLAGIHGEEPAGVIAIANRTDFLGELGKQVPIVLFPLCNPIGYFKDWRYFDEYRDWKKGHSVGASEHLLLKNRKGKPRRHLSTSPAAAALSGKILELCKLYPPLISIDHHEDEDTKTRNRHPLFYIYTQGRWRAQDLIAKTVVQILTDAGFSLTQRGVTRFGEKIINGLVVSKRDDSVDELLAAESIYYHGKVVKKPAADSVITIETPTVRVPLKKRIDVHEEIIATYPKFLELLLRQRSRQNF